MSSRRRKRKHKIKVFLFKLSTTFILVFIVFSAIWVYNVDNICKDLNAATDYYFTQSIFNNKKLSKIDSINLKFSDSKTAVVLVKGLSYDKPYHSTAYKAYFSKAENSSWKLDNIYDDSYDDIN